MASIFVTKRSKEGKNTMKKTEIAILAGLIISIILTNFSVFSDNCNHLRQDVLRLHIIANSDKDCDQNLKLKIRDKILEYSPELFSESQNIDEAKKNASEKLEQIEKITENEIKAEGFNYTVKAKLCKSYFETRQYDDFTLPAGNYDALKIEIGKAEGKNWWCVLFPALCIPAAQSDKALETALSQGEIDTVKTPKYQAKFKIVELFEKLKNSR